MRRLGFIMQTTRAVEFCVLTAVLGLWTGSCMHLEEAEYSNHHNQNQEEVFHDPDQNGLYDNVFRTQTHQTEANHDNEETAPKTQGNELHTLTQEEETQYRIDMLKLQFLEAIPDLAPPNATIPKVPTPLRYTEEPVNQRDQPDQPKVSQVVFFAEPAPAHTKRNGIAIFFNLTSAYASELIHSVELWLYKRRSHDHSNHTYVVSKLPDRHSHNRKKKPVDLASERVGKDPGWIEFKDATLRDKIMRWVVMANRFPNPLGTEGHLIITCPTCGDETPPIILEGDKKPFLAVNFKKIKKRYKRQAQWCQSNQNSCCKKMFKFNFHEAGLAAFLEPREYQPNYCRGSCEVRQYPEIVNMASSHYVSLIMLSRAFQERGKAPCCAPNQLSSLTVLYYNKDMIMVRKTLEKMVVESCGCH